MYQRARKLREAIVDATTFVTLAEDQLESLSVAINALHLVDEKTTWILMPVIPDPVCYISNYFIGMGMNSRTASVTKAAETIETYS